MYNATLSTTSFFIMTSVGIYNNNNTQNIWYSSGAYTTDFHQANCVATRSGPAPLPSYYNSCCVQSGRRR